MENEKFTKADIKVGYVVKHRNGTLSMAMLVGEEIEPRLIDTLGGYTYMFNEDLTNYGSDTWDIVEVYGYASNCGWAIKISTEYRTLLWKREEVKKMTVEEIEKELGYKIEIVS